MRRSAAGPSAVATLLVGGLVALLSGCSGGAAADVGQLVTSTTPTVTASPSASAGPKPVAVATPIDPSSGKVTGAGVYVYDSGGVVASVRLPADSTQDDVIGLRTFLQKAHSTPVRIISVTVTNHSSTTFSVSGFTLLGTPDKVTLYPVASYVNLAMALPGVANKSDLVSAGTIATLTSVVKIPPGAEITTLVGTQQVLKAVTGMSYQNGSTKVTLQPLWAIRQAAAKLARQQAAAAKRLAREQAAAARKLARERADRARKAARLKAGATAKGGA